MTARTILIIDDEPVQREALAGHLQQQGFQTLTAPDGAQGVALLQQHLVDLVLTDYRMPGLDGMGVLQEARRLNPQIEVVLMTAFGSVGGAVEAMRQGACHYLEKPIDLDELDQVVARALERHQLVSENRMLRARLQQKSGFGDIISDHPAMEEVLNIVARAAPSRATVLIGGESGTGKELIARAVHTASPRAERPFVAVNCAALNANLIESELFGHERGAFTGAAQKRQGRFEQASGGTLFIDEVAEMPPEAQAKLLRVLQERSFERVGGNQTLEADVRLIAATHRDLKAMVAAGDFREDLFYRLNVVAVQIPPLRQRRDDIPLLVGHFLKRYAAENGKRVEAVSKEGMDALMRHPYPGNVRELQNILERAVVMARDAVLTRADLDLEGTDGLPLPQTPPPETLPEQIEALERDAIRQALKAADGVQSRAAERLGITERNLRYKLKKYGLK